MDPISHVSVISPGTLTQLSKIFIVYFNYTGLKVNLGLARDLIIFVNAFLG